MVHLVKDLSREQRVTIEGLLGRHLQDDEGLNIQPSRILKDAPVGLAREEAYAQYLSHSDRLAERAARVSDDELGAAIDEALQAARKS